MERLGAFSRRTKSHLLEHATLANITRAPLYAFYARLLALPSASATSEAAEEACFVHLEVVCYAMLAQVDRLSRRRYKGHRSMEPSWCYADSHSGPRVNVLYWDRHLRRAHLCRLEKNQPRMRGIQVQSARILCCQPWLTSCKILYLLLVRLDCYLYEGGKFSALGFCWSG